MHNGRVSPLQLIINLSHHADDDDAEPECKPLNWCARWLISREIKSRLMRFAMRKDSRTQHVSYLSRARVKNNFCEISNTSPASPWDLIAVLIPSSPSPRRNDSPRRRAPVSVVVLARMPSSLVSVCGKAAEGNLEKLQIMNDYFVTNWMQMVAWKIELTLFSVLCKMLSLSGRVKWHMQQSHALVNCKWPK